MSKTYRKGSDGRARSDGGRHYSTPRYRPGSRTKSYRIVAVAERQENPDVDRLARVIAHALLKKQVLGGTYDEEYTEGDDHA
jgi:hypothetical protein